MQNHKKNFVPSFPSLQISQILVGINNAKNMKGWSDKQIVFDFLFC